MLQGHIQAEGEWGQPLIPSPSQEGCICTTAATQRWTGQVTESEWQGAVMPEPSQAQQGTNQASAQWADLEWHSAQAGGHQVPHTYWCKLGLPEPETWWTILFNFSCPFCRYRYIWLLFGVVPPADVFLRKVDEIFQGLPNVFCITDDILIAWFDDLAKDHDATFNKVLRICREDNLKLNRQMPFQMH